MSEITYVVSWLSISWPCVSVCTERLFVRVNDKNEWKFSIILFQNGESRDFIHLFILWDRNTIHSRFPTTSVPLYKHVTVPYNALWSETPEKIAKKETVGETIWKFVIYCFKGRGIWIWAKNLQKQNDRSKMAGRIFKVTSRSRKYVLRGFRRQNSEFGVKICKNNMAYLKWRADFK